MYNDKDVTLTLKRIEICDLLLACTNAYYHASNKAKKWDELHEKLFAILNDFDENHRKEEA